MKTPYASGLLVLSGVGLPCAVVAEGLAGGDRAREKVIALLFALAGGCVLGFAILELMRRRGAVILDVPMSRSAYRVLQWTIVIGAILLTANRGVLLAPGGGLSTFLPQNMGTESAFYVGVGSGFIAGIGVFLHASHRP